MGSHPRFQILVQKLLLRGGIGCLHEVAVRAEGAEVFTTVTMVVFNDELILLGFLLEAGCFASVSRVALTLFAVGWEGKHTGFSRTASPGAAAPSRALPLDRHGVDV